MQLQKAFIFVKTSTIYKNKLKCICYNYNYYQKVGAYVEIEALLWKLYLGYVGIKKNLVETNT